MDDGGTISGWTPAPGDLGTTKTFEIQAANPEGSDSISWQVRVRSRADFDLDGDVDLDDFSHLQVCLTGSFATQDDPTCAETLLDGDEDVDAVDLGLFLSCLGGTDLPLGTGCNL